MNKTEFANYWIGKMKENGVRTPDTFSAQEIKDSCPDIPPDFVDELFRRRKND